MKGKPIKIDLTAPLNPSYLPAEFRGFDLHPQAKYLLCSGFTVDKLHKWTLPEAQFITAWIVGSISEF